MLLCSHVFLQNYNNIIVLQSQTVATLSSYCSQNLALITVNQLLVPVKRKKLKTMYSALQI